MTFPRSSECKLFSNSFDIHRLNIGDLAEVTLLHGSKFWQIIYKHKTYTLALTETGMLCAFNGSFGSPNKVADLLILKIGAFNYRIIERRFTSDADLERILADLDNHQLDKTSAQVRVPATSPGIPDNFPSIDLYSGGGDGYSPAPFGSAQRPCGAFGGLISGRW